MAVPSFSWSDLVFGSMATEITGSGKVIDSRTTGFDAIAQGVAGGGVLQTHDRDDVARTGRVDLLTLVGVHSVDLADALFAVLGAVEYLGAGLPDCRSRPERR